MEFMFQVPTKIIVGTDCVVKNAALLSSYGKRAVIVKSGSAEKNGAFADVCAALEQGNVHCHVCANVPPNPTADDIAGLLGYAPDFDFVVAVGGGSAMDAAKGVAVLAVNDMPANKLYDKSYEKRPLPVVAVPTTCGTGSEVTQYSVLTEGETKKSFSGTDLFPVVALLDASYLETLPDYVTVDTALDALAHCVEGYLILDSWATEMLAESAFRNFAAYKEALFARKFEKEQLELMLYTSTLGGLVISMTGTSAVHTIGYPLTVKKDVPHGRACALTLGKYIEFSYQEKREKIDKMCSLLEVDGVQGFQKMLSAMLPDKPSVTEEELKQYTELAAEDAIRKKNARPITKTDIFKLYMGSLLG